MARLVIHKELIEDFKALAKLCPFGAIVEGPVIGAVGAEDAAGAASAEGSYGPMIDDRCRMCMICVKKSGGQVTLEEEAKGSFEGWRGIAVFAEQDEGRLHPVSLELIGKARELADKSGQDVSAVVIGYGLEGITGELTHYPVDLVMLYDDRAFQHFRVDSYTTAFEGYVRANRPGTILVGATPLGRNLAPRLAARLRTGLTADCTILDMTAEGALIQTRPAFGGNIMARIKTPAHRPQMATVRYKVMDMPQRSEAKREIPVTRAVVTGAMRASGIDVKEVRPKERVIDLTEADVIVVAGRGLKSPADMVLVQKLADALGAQVAGTRPLIEAGWQDPRRQIGLSGRTVKPKLIITCGVSGSVQFAAGMQGSDKIIAINSDRNASIFNIAHLGIVGDLYEVVPELTKRLLDGRSE